MNFPEGEDVTDEYGKKPARPPCQEAAGYEEKMKERALSREKEEDRD